jgi:hypothetical protein
LPERAVLILITFIFLPGTIIHELAHYIMAVILFLHVREISVFPEFERNYIKLGKVVYEKADFVRGILVGIAPIFAGLFIFWLLSVWNVFPNPNMYLSIVLGYLIFVISSSMFSSKQDLVDVVYIIPVLIIMAAIIYIFNINIVALLDNAPFMEGVADFIHKLNVYFLLSFVIHAAIIIVLKVINKLWKTHPSYWHRN